MIRPRLTAAAPSALAGLCAVAVLVIGGIIRGTQPWGPASRDLNDLGNQLVPFHALLWDVLHSAGPSSWDWNWSSGLGVPFLPDYATYLADPTTLLVGLFPRDRLELAIYLVSLLRIGLAAALMTTYLRAIRPSPVDPARTRGLDATTGWSIVLGAGYGACGWTLDDGSYLPMWLSGLVALPALLIVGEWARRRRYLVLGAAVVGWCWWSNFLTAYMATIGAVVLLVARLADLGEPPRRWVRTLGEFAVRGVFGLGLAAVLLWPTYLATRRSQPGTAGWLSGSDVTSLLARLLPLSEGLGTSPGLYVGTAALLACLTLLFNARVPWRTRLIYPGLVAAVLASMQFRHTQLWWNAGTAPNGGSFRAGFVACGVLVVTAWVATGRVASQRPRLPQVALAIAGVLALVVFAAQAPRSQVRLDPHAGWVSLSAAAAAAVALLAAARLPRIASSLLIVVFMAEASLTAVVIDRERSALLYAWPTYGPSAQAAQQAAQAAMTGAHPWPFYRVGAASSLARVANRSALLGIPGLTYYSSLMPAATSQALTALGLPWSGWGRAVEDTADPGLDPWLAIGSRLTSPTSPPVVLPAVPLVSVLPEGHLGSAEKPRTQMQSPFLVRNQLAGAPVYAVPPVFFRVGSRPWTRLPGPLSLPTREPVDLTTACPSGSVPQLWVPQFAGTWHAGGRSGASVAPGGRRADKHAAAGVVTLPRTRTGRVLVELTGSMERVTLSRTPLACLDPETIAAQVHKAHTIPVTVTVHGVSVEASWPRPVSGLAVVATTLQPGWRCASDGSESTIGQPGQLSGLLAVNLRGATKLTCDYQLPGLTQGWVGTLAAAGLMVLWGLWELRARRRHVRSARSG